MRDLVREIEHHEAVDSGIFAAEFADKFTRQRTAKRDVNIQSNGARQRRDIVSGVSPAMEYRGLRRFRDAKFDQIFMNNGKLPRRSVSQAKLAAMLS